MKRLPVMVLGEEEEDTIKSLRRAGFKENEARALTALIVLGPQTIEQVQIAAGMRGSTACTVLKDLHERGYIERKELYNENNRPVIQHKVAKDLWQIRKKEYAKTIIQPKIFQNMKNQSRYYEERP